MTSCNRPPEAAPSACLLAAKKGKIQSVNEIMWDATVAQLRDHISSPFLSHGAKEAHEHLFLIPGRTPGIGSRSISNTAKRAQQKQAQTWNRSNREEIHVIGL